MSSPRTVMMYSPDSIGLGHVKRNSAIARQIVTMDPNTNVILLVGSGAGAFFELPKGIDSIKLPSVDKIAADTWRPRSLSLSPEQTYRLRSNLLREAIDTVEPDALVIDHLPRGVWNELLPVLELIRNQRRSTKVILGLRDILDTPAAIRSRWQRDGIYATIERFYDKVLIYGQGDIVPTADLYGLSACVSERIEYCGYVYDTPTQRCEITDTTEAQKLPGLSALRNDQRVIFVQAGGGFDAYPMISATLSALRTIDDDDSLRSIVVAGPLMPKADRESLFTEAKGLKRLTLLPWTANSDRYFKAADVAIIMGGYNSFIEASQSTGRLICIPRSGPSAEQLIRAQLFAQRGLASCIPLEDATPDQLIWEINIALSTPPANRSNAVLGGARRAAQAILSSIADRNEKPVVTEPGIQEVSYAAT